MAAARWFGARLANLAGTGAGASVVLAFLVMGTVLVAVAGPRQSVLDRTRILHHTLASIPAYGRSVNASLDYASLSAGLGSPGNPPHIEAGALTAVGNEIASNLTRLGVPLGPATRRWSGMISGFEVVTNAAKSAMNGTNQPELQIIYREPLQRFSQLAAGVMPAAGAVGPSTVRMQVAVTTATAARFSLHPGSKLRVGPNITLTVTGILRPVQPSSSFWTSDPALAVPDFFVPPPVGTSVGHWIGSVFISASELVDLEDALSSASLNMSWNFPIAVDGITADEAGTLGSKLLGSGAQAGLLVRSVQQPTGANITTGLAQPLSQFLRTEEQMQSLVSMVQVSLVIVGLVVVLLGGRLIGERRAAEFGLMRARGAGRRRLAALALGASVVVALPAAAAGALIAVALTPGANASLAWWLGAGTAFVALAALPVIAVRGAPASATAAREDSPPARPKRIRRLVAEIAVAAAAVGGLAVLRQQGPPPPGGTDWFTSAAPVLVAIPVAIIVIRCYPLAVRWLSRLVSRRPGVTVFVGLARASRVSMSAPLPAFALVLALAVIAFGAMLRAAVIRGDVATSWRSLGADVVIDASHANAYLGTPAQRAVAALPGVRGTTVMSNLTGIAPDGTQLAIVAVDPASYSALIKLTPLPSFPAWALARPPGAGGTRSVPVLASPSAATVIGTTGTVLVGSRKLRVRVSKVVSGAPGSGASGQFIVAPYWALPAAQALPDRMLVVGPGVADGRLRALVSRMQPGSAVTFRSHQVRALTSAPLPHLASVTFVESAAAAAGFGVVIIVIMLALGARPREVTLARLFTMGLSASQARRLVVTEALPTILAAAAGGAAAALALVPLIGPSIDLSPLTGSSGPVTVRTDLGVVGYVMVGLLLLAMAALVGQSAAARRQGGDHLLRIGE